mmetsp:Transcript_50271/g.58070  ORF Transcript_50271/g.58070 Transcript_50271/m.58070 type:complete len:82 (-) Transcript_50271:751-996(-)
MVRGREFSVRACHRTCCKGCCEWRNWKTHAVFAADTAALQARQQVFTHGLAVQAEVVRGADTGCLRPFHCFVAQGVRKNKS